MQAILLSDFLGSTWRCCDEYGSYERLIVQIEDVADVRISSSNCYRYVLWVHVWRKVCHDCFHGHQASEDGMVRRRRLEAVSLAIFETPKTIVIQDPFSATRWFVGEYQKLYMQLWSQS